MSRPVGDNLYERASLCYVMAYQIIPEVIYNAGGLLTKFASSATAAARDLYDLTCEIKKVEPHGSDRVAVEGWAGRVGDHVACAVLYPRFESLPTLDQLEDKTESWKKTILFPYFSAVVYARPATVKAYYILGRSPSGGTTLRAVTATLNGNLGAGCEPDFDQFLADVAARLAGPPERPIAAGTR